MSLVEIMFLTAFIFRKVKNIGFYNMLEFFRMVIIRAP